MSNAEENPEPKEVDDFAHVTDLLARIFPDVVTLFTKWVVPFVKGNAKHVARLHQQIEDLQEQAKQDRAEIQDMTECVAIRQRALNIKEMNVLDELLVTCSADVQEDKVDEYKKIRTLVIARLEKMLEVPKTS